jgi:hypothetical protein
MRLEPGFRFRFEFRQGLRLRLRLRFRLRIRHGFGLRSEEEAGADEDLALIEQVAEPEDIQDFLGTSGTFRAQNEGEVEHSRGIDVKGGDQGAEIQ